MALAYSDFNQTPLIQHIYSPHHVVRIGMLDSQQSRRTALDQWCLRRILGFKWSDFVRNEDVRHATQQPPLSSIVKTRRLSLFSHIAQMNESTDASRILFEPPSEVWTKPRGRPRNSWVRTVANDLANSYSGLPEAREDAQDRVCWRMFTKHSATHS